MTSLREKTCKYGVFFWSVFGPVLFLVDIYLLLLNNSTIVDTNFGSPWDKMKLLIVYNGMTRKSLNFMVGLFYLNNF